MLIVVRSNPFQAAENRCDHTEFRITKSIKLEVSCIILYLFATFVIEIALSPVQQGSIWWMNQPQNSPNSRKLDADMTPMRITQRQIRSLDILHY